MSTGKEMVKSNGSNLAPSPDAGMSVREGHGEIERSRSAETATVAAAAQAEALVKARFTMAALRPRDLDTVRLRMLAAARRPAFARIARFAKPQGKKKNKETGKWEQTIIVGWSIRAAEEVIRALGNIDVQKRSIFDDNKHRIIAVSVLDLESNSGETIEVVVRKTVERSKLGEGQTAISTRINNYGEPVFIVDATDDELLTKANALASKAKRNAALGLCPGDLLDEMLDEVTATLERKDKEDPDATRKALIDGFASLGVLPAQLKAFLGHEAIVLQPAELKQLREMYTAIKSSEATWDDFVAIEADPDEATDTEAAPRTTADLKTREKEKAKAAKAAAPPKAEPKIPGVNCDPPIPGGDVGKE